ncbi:MAG: Clp protease ClpP [Immundisolibacteraceae bacterium]|nr:Clp protease ClpP [Immundisolibacteraceae bacterium]
MSNEILIYDEIGEGWYDEGITGKSIKRQLMNLEGDITVRINSLGGDVFEAAAIYNLLKEYEGKVIVKIDSIAASAASVIAMAGDEVIVPSNAMIMIHNPWTFAYGESKDFLKTAERLDKIKETIANVYIENTGISKNEIHEMMDEETWLTSEEAVAFGFASKEETETEPLNVKNTFRLKNFKNCPKRLFDNQNQNSVKKDVEKKKAEEEKKQEIEIENNKKILVSKKQELDLLEII